MLKCKHGLTPTFTDDIGAGRVVPGSCDFCHRVGRPGVFPVPKILPVLPCRHEGRPTRPPDGADRRKQYFHCEAGLGVVTACRCNPSCERYESVAETAPEPKTPAPPRPPIEWAIGVMTCRDRLDTLLPRTVASLKAGGFDSPRLFVDGADSGAGGFGLPVTYRCPKVNVHGNFVLSVYELYVRQPHADRYVLFQDDVVCPRNLRPYLETFDYPADGYWNLYACSGNTRSGGGYLEQSGLTGTYPGAPPGGGWFLSNQRGWGALGVVFDRAALTALLTSPHMTDRPTNPLRGWKSVDGGIVDSMRKAGRRELVHAPSLLQHTGRVSAMDKRKVSDGKDDDYPRKVWPDRHSIGHAETFPGEDFDLMGLVKKT